MACSKEVWLHPEEEGRGEGYIMFPLPPKGASISRRVSYLNVYINVTSSDFEKTRI